MFILFTQQPFHYCYAVDRQFDLAVDFSMQSKGFVSSYLAMRTNKGGMPHIRPMLLKLVKILFTV